MNRARLDLEFASAEEAARVAAALSPENAQYVRVRVEGGTLVAEADADSPLSLLHTLDDLLACAAAAQKAGALAR